MTGRITEMKYEIWHRQSRCSDMVIGYQYVSTPAFFLCIFFGSPLIMYRIRVQIFLGR